MDGGILLGWSNNSVPVPERDNEDLADAARLDLGKRLRNKLGWRGRWLGASRVFFYGGRKGKLAVGQRPSERDRRPARLHLEADLHPLIGQATSLGPVGIKAKACHPCLTSGAPGRFGR